LSAYLPSATWIIRALALGMLVSLAWGYALGRMERAGLARGLAWATLTFGTLGVERAVAYEPPGFRMFALVSVVLVGMKIIVLVEERAAGMPPLPLGAWLGFAAACLGMKPRLFGERTPGPRAGASQLLRRGLLNLLLGAALVVLARVTWSTARSPLLTTLLILPGLSLILHFGLCNLLTGAWRLAGIDAEPLFVAPLRAESLSEFWARRWNLGFSEMTTIAVYRPLSARLGRTPALLAGFALSGLLHEVAISVPVRAGFGLPFLYFMLQGGLVLVERALRKSGYALHGVVGRAWAIAWVVLPLPLAFHRPFLTGVVWPLVEPW